MNNETKHPFISNKWLNNLKLENKPSEWIIDENENFAYIPNKNIESIFLGNFPTYNEINHIRFNNNKEFFYGDSKCIFWDIYSHLTGIEITSEEDYFKILSHLNIGITDIIKNTNDYSPVDFYSINNTNDFLKLKDNYFPNLKNIIYHYPIPILGYYKNLIKDIKLKYDLNVIVLKSTEKLSLTFARETLNNNKYFNNYNLFNNPKIFIMIQHVYALKDIIKNDRIEKIYNDKIKNNVPLVEWLEYFKNETNL